MEETPNKKIYLWVGIGVFLFICTQVAFFLFYSLSKPPKVNPIDAYTGTKGKIFTGNIFFTGDTSGFYEPAGCERMGSLPRRASLLKKFDKYLYLDFGNFTSGSLKGNKTVIPIQLESYRYMGLNALNLTKKDAVFLEQIAYENPGLNLISANLKIDTPTFDRPFSKFIVLPFILTNSSGTREIKVGITGITNNLRQLHGDTFRYSVQDIALSLKEVENSISGTDLKILLFNDSFFTLEKLVKQNKIRFDLVLAHSTLPEHINKMIRIENIPVVFCDEHGRSIGYIKVLQSDKDKSQPFTFEYDFFVPGMGASSDEGVKNIIQTMEDRFMK
jgi:hypothetical protein